MLGRLICCRVYVSKDFASFQHYCNGKSSEKVSKRHKYHAKRTSSNQTLRGTHQGYLQLLSPDARRLAASRQRENLRPLWHARF